MKLRAKVLAVFLVAAMAPLPVWAQTRTDILTYEDNTAKWVIGLPKSSTNVETGLIESRNVYDANGLPIETYAFEKLKYKATYDTKGILTSVSDGRDTPTYNTTVSYSNWMRGTPQTITFPDGKVKTAVVNTLGQIASVTDETGAKTCYDYDAMGRMSKITYPSETTAGVCDTSTWLATTITFNNGYATAYGVPAGHWRQTTLTGNARKTLIFDALWRPVVEQDLDLGNVPNTTKEIIRRYDDDGRVVFESYPMNTAGQANYADLTFKGTTTTYDALGRTTQVTQDSELGALLTKVEYLAGFKMRVTSPRNYQTTISYYAWDTPTQEFPFNFTHPEGAITSVSRDQFGKTTAILRRSVDNTSWQRRYFLYNQYQELCSRTEVETGTTSMGYDAAGNLAWSAPSAQTWLPGGPCAGPNDAAIAVRRADRTYDQRNRVTSLTFPDHRGDTTYTYTPDSQLNTLVANNGNNETVTNTYTYNARRLLTNENMQTGASINWNVGRIYTAHGNLSQQVYPGAITVGYAPDALGRATQAAIPNSTVYVYGALYHPNGAVKSFAYGNGETHTMTQNLRGLPEHSRDSHTNDTIALVDDYYDYDANGNVAGITDGLANNVGNRDMTYDGLDRLKTVVAPKMFGASGAVYAYDALDNMTRVSIGGSNARDYYYCYDSGMRLTNVKSGSCAGSSVIGLGYDVQGNLANKNGDIYEFDFGNRLRKVTKTNGSISTYAYDGVGRRVRETVTDDIFSMFTQDGTLMYQEDHQRGKKIYHIYLSGDEVAQSEVDMVTGTAANLFQHTDALGTPVVVTNGPHQVVENRSFEPYGAVSTGQLRDGVGYVGQLEDAATALDYMEQRYYDPSVGRFLSVDPVSARPEGDNFNRYAYVGNSPYTFTDPDGRERKRGMDSNVCGITGCNAGSFKAGDADAINRAKSIYPEPSSWATNPDRNEYSQDDFFCSDYDPGCSEDMAWQALRDSPSPFEWKGPVATGGQNSILPFGKGDITYLVFPEKMTVVNVTNTSHMWDRGFVERRVARKGNSIYIKSREVDIGAMKGIHMWLGPWVWKFQVHSLRNTYFPPMPAK